MCWWRKCYAHNKLHTYDSYWFIFSGTSHLQVESLFLLSSLIFHDFTEESSTFTPVNSSVKRIFRNLLSRSRGTGSWNMDWMIRYQRKKHLERPPDFWKSQESQISRNQIRTCSLHNSWMSCFLRDLSGYVYKGPFLRCKIWETNPGPADPRKKPLSRGKSTCKQENLLISMRVMSMSVSLKSLHQFSYKLKTPRGVPSSAWRGSHFRNFSCVCTS